MKEPLAPNISWHDWFKHQRIALICYPLVSVLVICSLLISTAPASAGPRDAQWKKVEEAVNQGLPKTAITNLEPIIEAAIKDKAYAEAVKAIGKKIALEGNIQGNKPEEKIPRLEAESEKPPLKCFRSWILCWLIGTGNIFNRTAGAFCNAQLRLRLPGKILPPGISSRRGLVLG